MVHLKKNIAISDSGFIFNPSTGDSYSSNPLGLEIIKMLKDGKTEAEIKSVIIKTYSIDETTLEIDLADFMSILLKNKLLVNEE